MDPKVNGQIQREWSWLLAGYLFLGGIGGGAYTIGALNSFIGGMELTTTIGLYIGFPALLIGSILLILDLGSPTKAFLAGNKPGSSWIARGFWIISLFMVMAFLDLVIREILQMEGGLLSFISIVGIITGIGTMAYTGILLGSSKGIPFWRTGVLPVVFVVSAMVTGHFSIMIGMVLVGGSAAMPAMSTMAAEAVALVVLEVLAIFFFLLGAWKLPDSRESAQRILKKQLFVVGYILIGLATPMFLMLAQYYAMRSASVGANMGVAFIGGVLGLIGGLILRQAVLMVGALPTLNVGGFKFRRIARPKETKPSIGLMPPT